METETPEIGPYFAKVGPEIGPNADQLTALTRGRGPRRGNLEDLLKYWRPIMKKPGGFRRCVVILMDKPQFGGRPQRICAWLHHELTGKWPNEGNHHGRGGKGKRKRRGKLTRRVRSAARKAKSVDLSRPEYSGSSLRYAVSESRAYGGILVQPIAGRQNVVDMKAAIFRQYLDTPVAVENDDISVKRVGIFGSNSRFGQAAQAVGSSALPGNVSVARSPVRSAVFRTLTPGGGSGRGRRLAGAGRRLLGRSGRGARNRFRCPPGFENGGTFTDRRFSTCGAQILGIPNFGPGSLLGGTGRALARLARNAELISSIGDLRSQKNPGVFIRAAQIPSTPKKVNVTARASGVNTILNAIGDTRWNIRVSKRDGVILEPVAGLSFFANQTGDFDDVVDGSLVVRNADASFDSPEIIEAVQSLNAGFKDVYFAIPEVGVVRFGREGGELSPADRASLTRTLPTRISRDADIDPTAGLRGFADDSGGKFVVEFGNLNEQGRFTVEQTDNTLVKVQGPGGTVRQVPQWVYETFLSRSAPRRAKDDPIFELVPEGKSVNPFFITAKAVQPDTLYKEYQADIAFKVDAYKDQAYLGGVNFKRVRPGGVPLRRALGGFASALAFFDPSISRYRCPPGFTGGGQLTNMRGTTCGSSLESSTMFTLGNLQDARGSFFRGRGAARRLGGVVIDDEGIEEGSFRQGVFETQAAFDQVIEDFDKLSKRLPEIDQLDDASRVNAPPLTDDVRAALDQIGVDLSAALRRIQFSGSDELDEPSWDALASRLQDIATLEARRQSYIRFYGIESPNQGSPSRVEQDIDEFASRLVGIAKNQRVATTVDEVTEEGVAAVSELDQAEARVSALLTAHADGELWDVEDFSNLVADFETLYDADYTSLERQEQLDDLMEKLIAASPAQASMYLDKFDKDPDSFSLEEYAYLANTFHEIRETFAGRLPGDGDQILGEAWGRSLRLRDTQEEIELGQVNVPVADRSTDALVYGLLSFDPDGFRYVEVYEEFNTRMRQRLLDDLLVSGFNTDKLDENDVGEAVARAIDTGLSSADGVDPDKLYLEIVMAVPMSELSDKDRELLIKFTKAAALRIDRVVEIQRLSRNERYQTEFIDDLYERFLAADRDVTVLVQKSSPPTFERDLRVVQQVINALTESRYESDAAWANLRAMIDFKNKMVKARADLVSGIHGIIDFTEDDTDLVPETGIVPRWLSSFRNRKKRAVHKMMRKGLEDLSLEDYNVSREGETTLDTMKRMQSEGTLEAWAAKAMRAVPEADAKDPSKREVVGKFEVDSQDGATFFVKIDNVLLPNGVIIRTEGSDTVEIELKSVLYATVYDKDGRELKRVPITKDLRDPNVRRNIKVTASGQKVDHALIAVNDPDAPTDMYSIMLPNSEQLLIDNRKHRIASKLNNRFLGMTFAAGFKDGHKLEAAWDGNFVWPRSGARSDDESVIKNIDMAFRSLLSDYDSAKAAIATGRKLTSRESGALLLFNGDDKVRDRVASLLNYNFELGSDDRRVILRDWAQHSEFIEALLGDGDKTDGFHTSQVRNFFRNPFGSIDGSAPGRRTSPRQQRTLIARINSFMPEGSSSRLDDVDDLKSPTGHIDTFVSNQIGFYRFESGEVDLSMADLSEIGCRDV